MRCHRNPSSRQGWRSHLNFRPWGELQHGELWRWSAETNAGPSAGKSSRRRWWATRRRDCERWTAPASLTHTCKLGGHRVNSCPLPGPSRTFPDPVHSFHSGHRLSGTCRGSISPSFSLCCPRWYDLCRSVRPLSTDPWTAASRKTVTGRWVLEPRDGALKMIWNFWFSPSDFYAYMSKRALLGDRSKLLHKSHTFDRNASFNFQKLNVMK